MRSKASAKPIVKNSAKPVKIDFYLPPGISLSDIFIDGAQVIQELFISKRTLLNWRNDGRISYSDHLGKIFYFKQEIARILIEGKQCRKK